MAISGIAATQALALNLMLTAPAHGAAPPALTESLAEFGCRNIPDDDPVLRNRGEWWVSLEMFTGGDADFAFYCQSTTEMRFSIIVVIREEVELWRDCDPVVASWQGASLTSFPMGLEVSDVISDHPTYTDLSRWWLVSSSSNPIVTRGPEGVSVPNPIIDTTGQRAGSFYACYAGEWYAHGVD